MAVEALGDKPSGLTLMWDIVDMLKLLHYEVGVCEAKRLAPLPRSYFESPDDKAGGGNAKFYYFRCLVLWLLQLNSVEVEEKGDTIYVGGVACCEINAPTQDSNNGAVATVLLDKCKSVGVNPDGASSLRIKAGWGEPVCILLHALLKHTLSVKGVKLLEPQHVHADVDEAIPGGL
jgi:hypothetical protein